MTSKISNFLGNLWSGIKTFGSKGLDFVQNSAGKIGTGLMKTNDFIAKWAPVASNVLQFAGGVANAVNQMKPGEVKDKIKDYANDVMNGNKRPSNLPRRQITNNNSPPQNNSQNNSPQATPQKNIFAPKPNLNKQNII